MAKKAKIESLLRVGAWRIRLAHGLLASPPDSHGWGLGGGSQVPRKTFQPRCDAARLLDLARAGHLLADLDRLLGERPFLTEAV